MWFITNNDCIVDDGGHATEELANLEIETAVAESLTDSAFGEQTEVDYAVIGGEDFEIY